MKPTFIQRNEVMLYLSFRDVCLCVWTVVWIGYGAAACDYCDRDESSWCLCQACVVEAGFDGYLLHVAYVVDPKLVLLLVFVD